MKLRTKINGIVSQSQWILEEIPKDDDEAKKDSFKAWGWAANAQNRGRLSKMLDDAKKGLQPFHRKFLSEPVVKLKKENAENFLHSHLTALFAKRKPFQSLDKLNTHMLNRHQSVLDEEDCDE